MKKIAIDAGHYLGTAGKRIPKYLDENETKEWVLNNRVATEVCNLLKDNFEILRVDDMTGKKFVSLQDRVKKANNANVDYYISIHHNAGINLGTGGGITVFYSSKNPFRKKQATSLYNRLILLTGLKGNRRNPIKFTQSLYVTTKTKAPALLCELGFMDSKTDCPIILTEDFAKQCSIAIAEFIKNDI